jgi:hypothetical protein
MSPPEKAAAPGWYLDGRGTLHWWNGLRWTQDEPDDAAPRTPDRTIDWGSTSILTILALVLSVVVAPVGLVLGCVSIAIARRQLRPTPLLAVVAAAAGALGTTVGVFSVLALGVLAQ